MRYRVRTAGRNLQVALEKGEVRVNGVRQEVAWSPVEGTPVSSLLVGHRSYRVLAARGQRGRWALQVGGWPVEAEVEDERRMVLNRWAGSRDVKGGTWALRAPMPGLVVKVEVKEGDEVAVGQALLVVEAMKMENELRSEAAGRVSRVGVRAGEAVEKDQVLLEISPLGEEPAGSGARKGGSGDEG